MFRAVNFPGDKAALVGTAGVFCVVLANAERGVEAVRPPRRGGYLHVSRRKAGDFVYRESGSVER